MVLKKPSDYFKKEKTIIDDSVQELVKMPELNTFSDSFESFKHNLSKIEILSEFSETLDNYRVNIDKVNYLSEKVEDIQTEVQTLLKKEDLDRAMMSQLIVVEQSVRDVQNKVKGINEKNLVEIRSDVSNLTKSVDEFLENEVPKYKKLFVDAELRSNRRYEELEQNVNQTLESIGEFVDEKYQELTENLQGINEESLSSIINDFKELEENILEFRKEEIPKYKSLIVETERKTESKLNQFDEKLDQTLLSFGEKIEKTIESDINSLEDLVDEIDDKFIELKEREIPKYKSLIVETERKTEFKLNEFQEKLNETVFNVLEKVKLIEGDNTDLIDIINRKIDDVNQLLKQVKFTEQSAEDYKNTIKKKVSDLEVDIIRNETHIRVQNKNLEAIQEEVKQTLGKINLEELENQNHKLGKKIKYLEEIFEKFSEKEILTENIIVEPPSTDNEDPLTPLDKNFVTLDQLQDHYRLFINRIQQQLSTIGGGGETRLKYLDDIVGIATNAGAYDGKFLKYDHGIGKFEFVTVSGGGGNVAIAITNIPPTNPSGGNLWYDLDIGRTFIYYTDVDGSQWVDANPSGSFDVGLNVYNTYPTYVGVVTAIDFGNNLTVSPILSGIVTITAFGGYWTNANSGIYTTGNVAIGTNVVSSGSTSLWIEGDARITDILSVGQGTIILDGNTNLITTPTLNIGIGGTIVTTTGIGSVGIGTTNPQAKLDVVGDIKVGINTSQGLILTSPNGTQFRLSINNSGNIISTPV